MVINKQIPIVIVISLLVIQVTCPGGEVCSTFCAVWSCTDWTMDGCGGTCSSNSWVVTGTSCTLDITQQRAVIDMSIDDGGELSVSPDPGMFQLNCDISGMDSGKGVGTNYFGPYTSNQIVTVYSLLGTNMAHYSLDIYFNALFVDVDLNDGWKNGDMKSNLVETGASQTNNIQTGGNGNSGSNYNSGDVITADNKPCGDQGKKEVFSRFSFRNYAHTDLNTPYTF